MADANATKATDTSTANPTGASQAPETGEKPLLVAVEGEAKQPVVGSATPAEAAQPEKRGVSRVLFGIVALLLLLAVVGVAVQTQRVQALESRVQTLDLQVEGLRTELVIANTQIQTYAMTMSLVRDTVSDIFEKTALLSELVRSDAGPPPPEALEAP
jgi:hypothetical protein